MPDSRLNNQSLAEAPPTARPCHTGHALGPLWRRIDHPRPAKVRLWAGLFFGAGVALLMVASQLHPDQRGVGTHEQLGLPPCGLIQFVGIPCPTCGMTTAYSLAVRGRLIAGLATQPFGLLLALGTILSVGLSAVIVVSGKSWRVNWYRISPNRAVLLLVVFFVLAWLYKIVDHVALR